MFKTKEELAKFAVKYFFDKKEAPTIQKEEVGENLWDTGACFVTLFLDGQLHGCIGNYKAFEPLYKNIIRNAIEAATADYRFEPLQEEEIKNLKIEVSVLTEPVEFIPKNNKDLLNILEKKKPGLIIEKLGRKALFLPQVWEDLPTPINFLSHLCQKAGLEQDSWQKDMKFWIFGIKNI
jgi:AmmeMemoRadiSam system protein A